MTAEDNHFLALSQSHDPTIRGRAASAPRCPTEVLLTLLTDEDDRVSDMAFLNSSLPPDARMKIWEHVVKQGDFESATGAQLWRVMFTPNAPVDLMEHILSHDFDDLEPEPEENRIRKLNFFAWNLLETPQCPVHAVRRAIIEGPPRMRN